MILKTKNPQIDLLDYLILNFSPYIHRTAAGDCLNALLTLMLMQCIQKQKDERDHFSLGEIGFETMEQEKHLF